MKRKISIRFKKLLRKPFRISLLGIGVIGLTTYALADSITIPNTFVAGTAVSDTQMNANFSTVVNQLNKIGGQINIDSTNNRVGIGTSTPGSQLEIKGAGTTSATSSLNVTGSAGSSKLYVRDDGSIGVGTTSPGANNGKFTIHDSSNIWHLTVGDIAGQNLRFGGNGFTYGVIGTYTGIAGNNASGNLALQRDGGNVGIGTTSPGSTLEVTGSAEISTGLNVGFTSGTPSANKISIGDSNFYLEGADTNAPRIAFDTNDFYMYDRSTNAYVWWSDSSIRMRLESSGNLGVNTNTPTAKLDVRNSGTEDILNLYDGATEVLTVLDGGNVGIGTTSPQYKLDVVGDIRATGSVYYGGSSGNADGSTYTKPDFVFNDDYKPLSTEDVASYLDTEGHLPWMTSVKQEKKEHGQIIDMTRMAFETVETVENLQLQIIELNKKIERQQKQIERLMVALTQKE